MEVCGDLWILGEGGGGGGLRKGAVERGGLRWLE